MKPTSIIFLIFSIVILIFGSILCSVAEKKAKEQNVDLFIQKTDTEGNSVINFDIDETNVETIKLNTVGTKINVIPGAEVSHIELVNFKINTFTFNQENGIASFNDNTNLLTLVNLSGDGNQFLGIRHYKNTANFKSPGEKAINLYLSSEFVCKNLTVTSVSADVSVTDCTSVLNYTLETKTGSYTLENVKNAEKLDVSVTEKGNITLKRSVIVDINATMEEGVFNFVAAQPNVQTYALTCAEGAIYVDGEEYKETYNAASAAALVTCRVNVKNGSVIVNDLM